MVALFSEFKLKDITLKNRIAVPPMCQYNAIDGLANDWHLTHYSELARGGSGLVIVEATGVSPEGRITPGCLGLWNDSQAQELSKVAATIKKSGAVPGIQIAHAGRKASANKPWEGDDHLPEDHAEAWQIIGPSSIAFGKNLPRIPKEMNLEDISRVQQNFVDAAKRALDAGFEWLELHFAHGYLAQSFFSKHSNYRQDRYGQNLDGRSRFLLETMAKVRQVWPEQLPLTARFGVLEYDGQDEETLQESIQLVKRFKQEGLDLLNVSMGFSIPVTTTPWSEQGFMAPISKRIQQETGIKVASSWCIDQAEVANSVIENNQLDLVMIGRAMLANPHYPYTLAKQLNLENPSWVLPAPYAHWLSRYQLGRFTD